MRAFPFFFCLGLGELAFSGASNRRLNDVQPDDSVAGDWRHDFEILVDEMNLAGYDRSAFTDPSQLCSMPIVFCDDVEGAIESDADIAVVGGRSAYFRRKYFVNWVARPGYTDIVPLLPSAGKLRAVAGFRAIVSGGEFPPGVEQIGNGELTSFHLHGNGTHGIEGLIPDGFWSLSTKIFSLSSMPSLQGPFPLHEQASLCDHLTDTLTISDLPSMSGSIDFLTRCDGLKRLHLRTGSQQVRGNVWNVVHANSALADAVVSETGTSGHDGAAHNWEAWCKAEKQWSVSEGAVNVGKLRLSVGRVTGTLPAGLAHCASIAHVFQFFGSFSGNFPFSLATFTNIEDDQLFFGGEKPGFSGPLPEMPPQTSIIRWSGNQFTGAMPEQWGSLPNIVSIDISDNRITVPPLPWGHQAWDKTLPRILTVGQMMPPGLFKQPPTWDKFASLNVAHNPIGWHWSFFFSTIARYPTLRSVDASNTSMFGMAGDLFDYLVWDETMQVINQGGGWLTGLETMILNDNDLTGFLMFSNSPACRNVLCPAAAFVCTPLLANVYLPSLREAELRNNPRLTHVAPFAYGFPELDVRGTAAKAAVAATREECEAYVQVPVAMTHEGKFEPLPTCLFRQTDFLGHPTDENAVCAGVNSLDMVTGKTKFLKLDPTTFNEEALCKCRPGFEYSNAAPPRQCQACPMDTFRNDDVGPSCVQCPAFSTTMGQAGQTSQAACLCQKGYAMLGGVCEPCPVNTFSALVGISSLGSCVECTGGKVTEGEGSSDPSSCVCPTGTYTDGDACRPCPKGTYCDEIGMPAGKPCDDGYSTLQAGSKSELQCVCEGQSVDESGTVQLGYFDEGFLQALQGKEEANSTDVAFAVRLAGGQCRPCPGGMVCHGGLELLQRVDRYPVEYYPSMGESSSDELGMTVWSICKTDPELVDGNVVNQNCLRRFCEDESRVADPRCIPTFPELALGHWADPDFPFDVYKCQALVSATSDSFVSCPGGRPGTCSGGRTGLACGRCEDGSTMDVDGTCKSCEGGGSVPTVFAIIIILFGFPCLYYFMNGKLTSETSTMMATGISMGALLTLTQHFSVLGQLTVKWEEPMTSIWAALDIFMFNPKFLNSGCVFGDTSIFIGRILLPSILLSWLAVFALATQAAGRAGVVKESLVMVWPKVRNTMGQMFQAFYIAISMSCILALQCYSSPNGTSSLSQHPYILCGSGDHTPFLVFSVLGMIVYLFGFGAFYITACIVIPGRSQRGLVAIQAYRFIFFRFRPEFWYWGSVFLFRNLLLTLAGVLNPGNPYTGVMYLGLVALGFLIAQCVCWPWRSNVLNTLDTAILSAMVAIVFSTVPFIEVTEIEVLERTRDTLLGIMVAVFVVAVLTVVGSILGNMACKVREVRDPDGHMQRKEASMKTLSKAWADLTNCYRLDASRQMQFLTNLGAFDRAAVLKLAGVVDLELSRSEKGSKRSSRRVALNPQVPPGETSSGKAQKTSSAQVQPVDSSHGQEDVAEF